MATFMYELNAQSLSIRGYFSKPEITTVIRENLFTDDNKLSAAVVSVTAGTDGLAAGTAQQALQALATRVQALEDAAEGG